MLRFTYNHLVSRGSYLQGVQISSEMTCNMCNISNEINQVQRRQNFAQTSNTTVPYDLLVLEGH